VFGPFRVPVIFTVLVLYVGSLVSSFHETKAASAEGKNCWTKMCLFHALISCLIAVTKLILSMELGELLVF